MELLRKSAWRLAATQLRPRPAAGQRQQEGLTLAPSVWSVASRGLRDYPIRLLIRNNKFQPKNFQVDKEWSLGIELKPSEVKALRDRNGDLSAAFGEFYRGELFLHQMHIPVWRSGLIGRPEPTRVRKLLANKSELKRMESFMKQPSAQLIPIRAEVGSTGWIKVIMAQCFKANKVDTRKREDERDIKRQLRDW